MRLVESYDDDSTVTIGGRTFPAHCLIEGDDGVRILIAASLGGVPLLTWTRAHAAGARLLACPGIDDGWFVVSVETFISERTEYHPTKTFRLDLSHAQHFTGLPDYRTFLGAHEEVVERPIKGFVHLHAHSEMSPLDGLSTVDEMVAKVAEDGQQALAVTDHGVCAAHPHLQIAADKAGIKPIFGIEANFVEDRFLRGDPTVPGDANKVLYDYRHLILWAENEKGLRNIWAMSTEANRDGFYGRPKMDWDTISRYSEGVLASTACLRGPVSQRILEDDEDGARAQMARLLGIFGDRLYVELHTNQLPEQRKVNEALVGLARDFSLPTIAVSDSHYPTVEDKPTHRVWIASQTNKELRDEADLFAGDADYHLLTETEVRDSLSYLGPQAVDEAVDNTVAVAQRCSARVVGESAVPVFSKAPTKALATQRDVERLVDLCMTNWVRKCVGKSHPIEEYEARFEREMRLLINRSFCGYYLMVADYCDWSRNNGILVGPGRGSGSGSLVAYLSNITEIDPIASNLMFERFLTEGRKGLPDFDVDFPASKRTELTNYIIEKYGRENVVRVGTHIRLQNKGVVRALASVLKGTIDIHYPDIDAISKIIEDAEADKAGLGIPWTDLWEEHGDLLTPYRDKYPLLFHYADRMVNRLKTYGKHPAGVVIAPDADLVSSFPMRLAGDDLVIEFDMDAAEGLGLVKFDLLTLRTLDTIQQTVDLIRETTGDEVNVYDWVEEYTDPQVWDEISDGHTLGIFQIETPGGTRDTKRFRPQSIADLADVITLVRPGPKRSGLTETYFRRKAGDEDVTYLDPRLEPILVSTQGCLRGDQQVQLRDGRWREISKVLSGDEVYLTGQRSSLVVASQQTGVRQVGRLRLSDGRKVVLTPEHRVMTTRGWVEVQNLTENDLIPRQVGYRTQAGGSEGAVRQARLLGWLIGDGSISTTSGVAFTKSDESVLSAFEEEVAAIGDRTTRYPRIGDVVQVQVYGPGSSGRLPSDRASNILSLLREVGLQGCTSAMKFVPDQIMAGTREEVLAFLAAYWDTDGSVFETHATAKTISRMLADQISELLHSVGIVTTVYEYDYPGIFINVYDGEQFEAVRSRMVKVRSPLPSRGGLGWAHGAALKARLSGAGISGRRAERESGVYRSCLGRQIIKRSTYEAMLAGCGLESDLPANEVYSTFVSYDLLEGEVEVYDLQIADESRFVAGSIPVHNSMLYQEQIINICRALGGYSSEEADEIRRLLGKKQVEKVAEAGKKFISRCVENGTDRQVATIIWDQMAEFARYSFNLSHAYGYAVLGWWTAWLKHHYPVQFLTAALSTVDKGRIPEFINEARRMGYRVKPPDVNLSRNGFTAGQMEVRYGLDGVKGVGPAAVLAIVQGQPYADWDDFMARKGQAANSGILKTLAKVGTFDSLVENRRMLEHRLEWETDGSAVRCFFKDDTVLKTHGLPCTFDWDSEPVVIGKRGQELKKKPLPKRCSKACRNWTEPLLDLTHIQPYTADEVMDREMELLGVHLSSTPFDRIPADLLEDETMLGSEVETGEGGEYTIAGIVSKVRRHVARNGKEMAFISVYARDADLDVTVFSDQWEKYRRDLKIGLLCFATLYKNDRGLTLSSLQPL